MIGVIDYQAGNTRSVLNALRLCEIDCRLTSKAAELEPCDGVILPGVGSASSAMSALREAGLIDWIRHTEKPFLGICLGMQILYDFSDEGETQALGLTEGRVRSLRDFNVFRTTSLRLNGQMQGATDRTTEAYAQYAAGSEGGSNAADGRLGVGCIRIPHMGWNRIRLTEPSPLFMQIPDGSQMYFAHSFAAPLGPETIAATDFSEGGSFSSAFEMGNFFGVQFHPEKSGPLGLQLLKNFEGLCS
jgi:glutamine amidotransferase